MEDIFRTQDYAGEQADITPDKLGNNHVCFLPYLMGERSPINDTNARGTFVGMTMDTTRSDLTQAVLEGVAFAIRDSFEVARSRGIPVSCEVDIYGALSEYIGMCVSGDTVTLLDINNSAPASIYEEDIKGKFDYTLTDTFMGFHCGNTPNCKLCADRAVKYQLIQHRLLEPKDSEPDFTRGTLEGDIAPSDITFYRLQCDSEGRLRAYIAQGGVLPVKTRSFGGIGVFAIPEMGRFYRHVLIQKRYPHHGAVAFGHYGKALFEVFKFLGIEDIAYNHPKGLPYPTENPWA